MAGDKQKTKSQAGSEREDQSRGQPAEPKVPRSQAGTASISTDDAAVRNPAETPQSPEEVVSYQTSQVQAPAAEYPFESGGDVVREQRGPWRDDRQKNGRHPNESEEGGRNGGDEQPQQSKKMEGRDGKHNRSREEERADRPRKKKHEPRHEPAASQPTWKTLLMTAVLALICGVGGAWAYSAFFGSSKSDQKEESSEKGGKSGKSSGKSGGKSGKSGGEKSEGSDVASASEIPGFSSAKDAATFKKELEHLAHRLDLLGGRIDRLTTNEDKTPPVLHTMQSKMTDLEREVDEVARLPSKMNKIEQKISDLGQELKMLNDRVSGNEVPLAGDLAPATGASDDSPERLAADADPANEATLNLAGGLLREGHYSQSYQVLRRLQRARPRDARVWYLSALAHGLSTGEWDEQAKQLAEQGAACERTGHPSRHDIDEALAGISSAGRAWIASQRLAARTR